jgi:hypothetical protein
LQLSHFAPRGRAHDAISRSVRNQFLYRAASYSCHGFFPAAEKRPIKTLEKPYEKFAAMTDRHWDGLAAYCRPENKVSLGFVESLNNKIRVIQCRAYGLRDEEYLRLKILACMLPPI